MKIKVDLSTQGIQDAINQILEYQKSLTQKVELFVNKLSEKGVEIAKANILKYDAIDTSHLYESVFNTKIASDKNTAIFVVRCDADYAAFVEFGTGQLGQEGSYPYEFPQEVDWQYNVGETIFEIESGQFGWFYPKNGQWYFTQGMPSRPFMYETAMELNRICAELAKEIFRS